MNLKVSIDYNIWLRTEWRIQKAIWGTVVDNVGLDARNVVYNFMHNSFHITNESRNLHNQKLGGYKFKK